MKSQTTTLKNIRPKRGSGGRLTPAANRNQRQSAGVRARARGSLATSCKARLAASSREFESSLLLICREVMARAKKQSKQTRIMWMGKAITVAFARQHLGLDGP